MVFLQFCKASIESEVTVSFLIYNILSHCPRLINYMHLVSVFCSYVLTSSVTQLRMTVPFAFTAFMDNIHICGFDCKNFILYEFVR